MDATVVCIDQTKKSVQVEPRAEWFPRAKRPSVELSGQRDWTCLLDASTEEGDRFFYRFDEYVIADHAKHFILALCKEFEDDLIVVLDGAPYFQASAVTDLAARDDLAFVTLPAYSPEFNPVEECWRQLQQVLSNRFFDSLPELSTGIDASIDHLYPKSEQLLLTFTIVDIVVDGAAEAVLERVLGFPAECFDLLGFERVPLVVPGRRLVWLRRRPSPYR